MQVNGWTNSSVCTLRDFAPAQRQCPCSWGATAAVDACPRHACLFDPGGVGPGGGRGASQAAEVPRTPEGLSKTNASPLMLDWGLYFATREYHCNF